MGVSRSGDNGVRRGQGGKLLCARVSRSVSYRDDVFVRIPRHERVYQRSGLRHARHAHGAARRGGEHRARPAVHFCFPHGRARRGGCYGALTGAERRVVLPLSAQQQNAARAFVADDGAAEEDHGTHHVSRRGRFRDGGDELRHSDRGEPPAWAVRRRSLCRRDHGRKLAADDLHRDHPRLRLRHPAGARF